MRVLRRVLHICGPLRKRSERSVDFPPGVHYLHVCDCVVGSEQLRTVAGRDTRKSPLYSSDSNQGIGCISCIITGITRHALLILRKSFPRDNADFRCMAECSSAVKSRDLSITS